MSASSLLTSHPVSADVRPVFARAHSPTLSKTDGTPALRTESKKSNGKH